MAKLKLKPNPTFNATVDIREHGDGDRFAQVVFTFKHRPTDELEKFIGSADTQSLDDVGLIQAMAEGWDLDEEFSAENIREVCRNYRGAAFAIRDKYLAEHAQARLGN